MPATSPPSQRFTATDGVTIAYRTWSPLDARPVLLQHGFAAESVDEWSTPGIVAALVGAGHAVVTVDARGHGASDRPHDAARYGEARIAQDLIELVDVLGVPEFDLVGYSMGAVAALFVGASADPRLVHLVVGGIGSAAVELGGVDTRVLDGSLLAEAFLADDIDTVTEPGLAAWRAGAVAAGQDRLALGAAASGLNREPIPLARIEAPTLVLAGADDELAVRPDVLADAMQARLVILPGDHGSVRSEPGFASAIIDFLATVQS